MPGGGAAQASTTKTVPGTIVFPHQQKPDKPGFCSEVTFVQWADVPGTTDATATYTYRGKSTSKHGAAPFNDIYDFVTTFTVPAGSHWIQLSQTSRSGSVPSTCEDFAAKSAAVYEVPATVELTISDAAGCTKAQAAVKTLTKKISTLNKQLKKAKGKTRTSIKAKIKKAKKDLAKQQKLAVDACP